MRRSPGHADDISTPIVPAFLVPLARSAPAEFRQIAHTRAANTAPGTDICAEAYTAAWVAQTTLENG